MNHPFFSLLLTLGLAGCAAVPDLPPNYAPEAHRSEGLAIVSLTLSGKPLKDVSGFEYLVRQVPPKDGEAVTTTRHYAGITQRARWIGQAGDPGDAVRRAVVKGLDVSEPLDVLDAGRPVGRLVTLRLAAGEYEFHAWKVTERAPYGEAEHGPQQPFSYRFAVEPGRTVYLGRLRLHLDAGNTSRMVVEDRRDSDLALFKAKYPALAGAVAVDIGSVRP